MSVEISPLPQTEALSQSTLSSAEKRFAQQAGRVITDTIFYGKNVKGTLQETAHNLILSAAGLQLLDGRYMIIVLRASLKGMLLSGAMRAAIIKKFAGKKFFFLKKMQLALARHMVTRT